MRLIGLLLMVFSIISMLLCEELATAAIWLVIIGFCLMFMKEETTIKTREFNPQKRFK